MISIIIPVFNEEATIAELLTFLSKCKGIDKLEIVVVDGGSTDATAKVVSSFGVKFFESPQKGRASQMNYGAVQAKGEILYFLHSDTFPPKDFIEQIKRAVNKGYQSGCFRLSFDIPHPVLKFYSWFTQFDIDFFRFGDQSLFTERELFERAGGFDEKLLVMEDQELVKALKGQGKFKILEDRVITSARKYQKIGVIKLQVIFLMIVMLYYLGVNQITIAHFYRESLK